MTKNEVWIIGGVVVVVIAAVVLYSNKAAAATPPAGSSSTGIGGITNALANFLTSGAFSSNSSQLSSLASNTPGGGSDLDTYYQNPDGSYTFIPASFTP